ncbi:MAG TPA: azurin [Edaphocola sp.]|nr:azurin [Edaphocola sp.]
MKKLSLILLAGGLLALTSCGGGTPEGAQTQELPDPKASMATVTTIELTAGDDMKFNAKSFAIPVGQEVTLRLTHTGKMSKSSMGHNVVILKPGEAVDEYGIEASKAGDENYVPAALADKVVAHTELIGGGENTEIKFTINEAGEYPFLCSFPGHYPMMKGIITVK